MLQPVVCALDNFNKYEYEDWTTDIDHEKLISDNYSFRVRMMGFDPDNHQTNEDFKIPHDLKILKEIFNISNGKYNTNNFYWTSYNLNKLINKLPKNEQKEMKVNFNNIKFKYKNLSNKYQLNKKNNKIPLK